MIIKEITNYLEHCAPLEHQESYDNSGLIVGNENTTVTSALVTLDCTEEVVAEAKKLGANLIIAHHPIVFTGLKKLNGNTYVERTVIKAIENKIAIYAIHTNLDHMRYGVNAKIGALLGLSNLNLLRKKADHKEVGAGMIGELSEPLPEVSFLKRVKSVFDVPFLKYTPLLSRKVKSVAYCGGSGSFLLTDAIAQGADVFLSSDFKYHQYFDHENKILIVDVGHYEVESCTKELICEILTEKFPTFTLHFSEVNTNPVNYL